MVRVIAESYRLVQRKIRSRGTRFYGRLSGNGYDADDKRNNDGWSRATSSSELPSTAG